MVVALLLVADLYHYGVLLCVYGQVSSAMVLTPFASDVLCLLLLGVPAGASHFAHCLLGSIQFRLRATADITGCHTKEIALWNLVIWFDTS